MSVVKEEEFLPDAWIYCRGLEIDFEKFLKMFNAVRKAGFGVFLPDFEEYCYQYIFKLKKERVKVPFYISEKPEKGEDLQEHFKQFGKTIIQWQKIQRQCLVNLLKGKPKVLKEYVLQGIKVGTAPYETFTHAMRRYAHFKNLYVTFGFLIWDLDKIRKNPKIAEDIHTYMTARELLTISDELTVSVKNISSNIFNSLDLKRLFQCENCKNYYLAKKADERNKFCGDKCRIARWQKENR